MTYVSQNNKKIENAFKNSLANINKSIQNGMENLLQWGMEECLRKHDATHQKHLELGDAYGWLLCHNGSEVKRYITAYQMYNASANDALDSILPQMAGNGWRGAILASMKPRNWFVIREEIKFMRLAITELKAEDFSKYFKVV